MLITIRFFLTLTTCAIIILLQGCGAAIVPCAATGAIVAHDRRTAGTVVDDQAIEFKALHALSENKPLWKDSHITAVSYNNVLLLVGQTPTEDLKQQAEQAVSNIAKVRRVHNELTVEEPVPLSIRSQDTWITTQIKAKMLSNKGVKPSRVKVITENGIVFLMGLTTSEEAMAATDIAQQVTGVEKIIQIFEPSESN